MSTTEDSVLTFHNFGKKLEEDVCILYMKIFFKCMLLGRYEYFSVWSLMKIYSYAVAILVNEACLGVYVHLWIWYMYIHTCLSILRESKNLLLSRSPMSFFFTHRVIPTPSHVQIFLQKTLFSDTCYFFLIIFVFTIIFILTHLPIPILSVWVLC